MSDQSFPTSPDATELLLLQQILTVLREIAAKLPERAEPAWPPTPRQAPR